MRKGDEEVSDVCYFNKRVVMIILEYGDMERIIR